MSLPQTRYGGHDLTRRAVAALECIVVYKCLLHGMDLSIALPNALDLLEAGGTDDVPSVIDPSRWPNNVSSERNWAFKSEPEKYLNRRSLLLSMGKILGGGSSINVGVWARGHKADWDYYAEETNDPAWNYAEVLEIYKRVENLQGTDDETRRGTGGPVFLEQNQVSHPLTVSSLEAARSIGIPIFGSPNGEMMEGVGGASRFECLVRDGKRQSIFAHILTRAWASQISLCSREH